MSKDDKAYVNDCYGNLPEMFLNLSPLTSLVQSIILQS